MLSHNNSQAAEQWDGEHWVSLKDFYQLRYVLEGFASSTCM